LILAYPPQIIHNCAHWWERLAASWPPALGAWSVPNELAIHRVLLRRRPSVTAVVHAHPPAVVAWSLLDEPLVPLYGAYDIPGARLAAEGIPTWERWALIRTDELAGAMADALGDRPVVILRGTAWSCRTRPRHGAPNRTRTAALNVHRRLVTGQRKNRQTRIFSIAYMEDSNGPQSLLPCSRSQTNTGKRLRGHRHSDVPSRYSVGREHSITVGTPRCWPTERRRFG
jgi:Class II Aldolase and Adducin N-terminal domain